MRFRLGPYDRLPEALAHPVGVAGVEISDVRPVDVDEGAATLHWNTTYDVVGTVACSARDRAGTAIVDAGRGERLPYFGWILAPLMRAVVRDGLRRIAAGRASRPWWAPPVPVDPPRAAVYATLCATIALGTFCGALLGQSGAYVASSFGADTATLSLVLAISRIGSIVTLFGSVLADRRGRRRVLVVAVAGTCMATLVSAAAPTLAVFTVAQLLARGFVNLTLGVAAVCLIEEAPEGGRAYLLSLAAMAGGAGFALGAILLVIADAAPWAWRILFAVGGAGIVLLPGLAARLPESSRFADLAARGAATGRVRELVDRTYRRRFALFVTTAFLTNAFAAASSQLTNPFLHDERGYSAFGILVLRIVAQGPLLLVVVWIGGRLAESAGRRPLVIWGTFCATVLEALFFLAGGPLMWLSLFGASVAGALAAPAFGAMGGELFPTEVRGTASAGVLVGGVLGGVAGLAVTGWLSTSISLGAALAVVAVPAALAAVVLVPFLPEGAGRDLDDLSPPEV